MIILSGIAGGMCKGYSNQLSRGWKAAPTTTAKHFSANPWERLSSRDKKSECIKTVRSA
jgi:hypothetical protein